LSIPTVVLAAGASTRLGEPKQLVMLGGETLLERAVRIAREAQCLPVVVVIGADYLQVVGNTTLGDVVTVINDEWQEGMASSIRLGVRSLGVVAKDAEGVLLMTCDQPAVTVKHLVRLITKAEVNASRYAGKNGVPAFFPKKYFGKLMELKGDVGARELLAEARYEELENGELDVDTMKDLERARELFG
jgi:molybdenum cofactor cytidylyltransferase